MVMMICSSYGVSMVRSFCYKKLAAEILRFAFVVAPDSGKKALLKGNLLFVESRGV